MNILENTLNSLDIKGKSDLFDRIKRGIEKENIRMNQRAQISSKGHPAELGMALTHHFITTDFAESLLEMITPPVLTYDQLLNFLQEIEHYVLSVNPHKEFLWPFSMPPAIDHLDQVNIAQYGDSPSGQMKQIYRRGLTHRYGKAMQLISGIHYNLSFPDELLVLLNEKGEDLGEF